MKILTSFPLGKRSRWLVIGTWVLLAVALAGLQPKLQAKAADESETFRARGAESTTVHHLLDSRFKEGPWSTAVIAFQATRGSVYEASDVVSKTVDSICASDAIPDLQGIGGPGGVACGEVGHDLGPENPPSAFSNDSPETMLLIPVISKRDDTESVSRDVAAIRRLAPKPTAKPVRSFVTGRAGFDADRSAAVEGIDGTLLAITGVLVLVLMLLTYRSPLIAALMLAVVAIAYVITTGIIYGLVKTGATTVSGQSTAILIVLMFGA